MPYVYCALPKIPIESTEGVGWLEVVTGAGEVLVTVVEGEVEVETGVGEVDVVLLAHSSTLGLSMVYIFHDFRVKIFRKPKKYFYNLYFGHLYLFRCPYFSFVKDEIQNQRNSFQSTFCLSLLFVL